MMNSQAKAQLSISKRLATIQSIMSAPYRAVRAVGLHEDAETREWGFVFLVTAIVILITSIPYAFAYLSVPHDKVFMGVMLGVPDHEQYFSWMRELSAANLASNKLTPEPNQPVFFNLLWWVMGRAGILLNLGIGPMYQLLRVTATAAFFGAVYVVVSRFIQDVFERRLAFLLVVTTSGLGWILVLLKYTLTSGQLLFPLDVFIAEGNTFLDVMAYPHFVAAGLYILVFHLVLVGLKKNSMAYSWAAGGFAFILGWAHAYDLILVYGVLGVFAMAVGLRDRTFPRFLIRSMMIVGLVSVWPAVYSVLLTRLDPVWKQVLAQFGNAGVYSPNPLHLLIVMGLPLMLALVALFRASPLRLEGVSDEDLFLRTWFVTNLVLLYIPTDYQVHMLNGLQIPTCMLAAGYLISEVAPRLRSFLPRLPLRLARLDARKTLAFIVLAAVLPTNVYLWAWRFVDLSRYDYPYFLHSDEVAALDWLDAHAKGDDVVLSSLELGQFVPAYTGAHAFLGHWAQTVDFYGKQDMVGRFYSSASSEDMRIGLLESFSVDYVIDGEAEQQLGDFDPSKEAYLSRMYTSGQVTIYRFDGRQDASGKTGGDLRP